MLAKDNKHLQDTNKTFILKINELDVKNNDLLNKCKTIETESSIQLNNLRGKLTDVNNINDNQQAEIIHLKNKLHDSQNDELLNIKSKFLEELQIKNTALNDKTITLNSIIEDLNAKHEKIRTEHQKN